MKKLTIGISALALAVTGTAFAQGQMKPRQDTNGDGVVTRAEAQAHAAEMFAHMDANKDGSLTEADREARQKERRTKMFDMMDTNKNGQISRDEFMAFNHEGMRGDRRGDKKDWGHRGMGRDDRGGRGMMGMADTNKDGKISKAEFSAAAMYRFDRMDTNKDGKVTSEERQAARQAKRDKVMNKPAPPSTAN